tara:strand:- start:100 stop:609 length:510 start_codon:yes stop_codon:yes gene_type:complete
MALFGSIRDASLFRHLNREIMGDIITQQCAVYKLKIAETKVNIYGEAAGARYYHDPVLLNTLIDRGEMEQPTNEFGEEYSREVVFKFLRDDLVDAVVVPEVGDIIMYYEDYFEIDTVINNQLFAGKDPKYPYNENPLNPGLEGFGMDISIICKTHYTSADRVQITKERI